MFRPLALLALLALTGCSDAVSPRAERVFYRGDGAAAWGTVCRLNKRGFLGLGERGYVSVAHVTENGVPLVGPTDAVMAADSLSDWSFLGIDPARLDVEDYPEMKPGQAVSIHGFPARDRDGEVVPGVVYTDDPMPPFWWIELRDADRGIAAEGVIGGFSGSCVFDERKRLVAVVHANGFSRIEGTTNTWAKVVPIRDAIRQAQGRRGRQPETMLASAVPAWRSVAPAVAASTIERERQIFAYPPEEPSYRQQQAYRQPVQVAPETYAPGPEAQVKTDDPAGGADIAPYVISTQPYYGPAPAATASAPQPAPVTRMAERRAWRRCAACL